MKGQSLLSRHFTKYMSSLRKHMILQRLPSFPARHLKSLLHWEAFLITSSGILIFIFPLLGSMKGPPVSHSVTSFPYSNTVRNKIHMKSESLSGRFIYTITTESLEPNSFRTNLSAYQSFSQRLPSMRYLYLYSFLLGKSIVMTKSPLPSRVMGD